MIEFGHPRSDAIQFRTQTIEYLLVVDLRLICLWEHSAIKLIARIQTAKKTQCDFNIFNDHLFMIHHYY